jgi:VIT1/CCC1 family predicted Fe2+/Mn2+ transporter
MSRLSHSENHMVHRIGWLRAAVLGANDGLVSTSSLVVGVAAAGTGASEVLLAGLAGLVAGAMSMAAGEYVSVSSQADAEQADLARERRELEEMPEAELEELTMIYVSRGLDRDLAEQVAHQLTERDALGAHARDELGISETIATNPIQAALVSALTFSVGAVVPLIVAILAPPMQISLIVAVATLLALAVLGGLGASAGGAGMLRGAIRVTFWVMPPAAASKGRGVIAASAAAISPISSGLALSTWTISAPARAKVIASATPSASTAMRRSGEWARRRAR